MKNFSNYSITIVDDYTLYYLGLQSLITREFGERAAINRQYLQDIEQPSTSGQTPDLLLLHIPPHLHYNEIDQLVKKLLASFDELTVVLYTSENRQDLSKNFHATGAKGIFELGATSNDIALIIGSILKSKNKKRLNYSKRA